MSCFDSESSATSISMTEDDLISLNTTASSIRTTTSSITVRRSNVIRPSSKPVKDIQLYRNADDELERLLQALEVSLDGMPLAMRAWVRQRARERAQEMSSQIFDDAFRTCGEYLPDTEIPEKMCQDEDNLFAMTWDALRCNTGMMNYQEGCAAAGDDDSLTAQPGLGSLKSPFLSFAIYSLSCNSSTPPARSDIITMETEEWEDELKEGLENCVNIES